MLYELFLPLGIFMWPHQSTKWHLKGPLATPKCYTLSSLIVYSCCYHGENVNWSRINSTWVTSSHHERNHVISPTQSILPYTVGKHNILHHRLHMHVLCCCCSSSNARAIACMLLPTTMLFHSFSSNSNAIRSFDVSATYKQAFDWFSAALKLFWKVC